MLNTKSLGKAVGIQNQGVQDNSRLRAGQGGAVGVIIGQFRRGSLNKSFPVTIENYRARLGYEPDNPFYVAVQDLFALGYPLVWIQRVGDSNSVVVPPVGQISCDGATDSATLTLLENPDVMIPPTGMTFEVNGVQETFVFGDAGIDMNAFHAKFPNLELGEAFEVRNNSTTEHLRIRFQGYPPEQDGFLGSSFTGNPTGGSSNGWATVCLAPKEEIEDDDCSSTAMTFEIVQSWNGMNESGYEKSIKLYDATTNELLGIGEAPIEADNGDYSNILPDFIENLNAGNDQIMATPYTDDYESLTGFKLVSRMHREFRLEVFIGNEGGVSVVPSPDTTMNDVGINDSAASEHGAVIVNFCLQPHQGCEPIGLDIPDVNLPSGIYTINVARDGFGTESNNMQFSGNIRTNYFFGNILVPFIANDENPFAYFTGGSGSAAYFQIQHWAERIEAAGEMDVDMQDPCTLTLSGSAIEAIYGQEFVEIHSCGRKEWMGV